MRIDPQIKIYLTNFGTGLLRIVLIGLLTFFSLIFSDADLLRLSSVPVLQASLLPFSQNEQAALSKTKTAAIVNGFKVVEAFQPPLFSGGKPAMVWSGWSKNAYHITQDFGNNGHYGEDYGIAGNPNPGYEVRPIAEGKVVYAGWTGGNAWGFAVLIKHLLKDGKYYYSQYGHLYDLPAVQAGQMVDKETLLGYVGNTGRSFGPHLDLQIKELPSLSGLKGEEATVHDLGHGYAEKAYPFGGFAVMDPRTDSIYYKPSYFVMNYSSSTQ